MSPDQRGSVLNTSVLVLNRHYMAVRVVTARRAFVLLYREVAEVIDIEDGQFTNYDFESWCELGQMRRLYDGNHQDDWIRAVNFDIQLPRIVRLTRFDRHHTSSVRLNRRNLFARDGHCCQYCGQSLPPNQLSLDHVVPRSKGGPTTWENVVASCVRCNTKKGGRTPQEARMVLINRPKKPAHNPTLTMKLDNPKFASWKTFLPKGTAHLEMR